MSVDRHEFRSALDGSPSDAAPEGGSNTTLAMYDAVDIELVEEWLPRDPARSVEALLIILFVIFGCGLAAWVIAALR